MADLGFGGGPMTVSESGSGDMDVLVELAPLCDAGSPAEPIC